jgi:hypothetical protein
MRRVDAVFLIIAPITLVGVLAALALTDEHTAVTVRASGDVVTVTVPGHTVSRSTSSTGVNELVPAAWLFTGVAAIYALISWKASSPPDIGLCRRCGYDLRATPERCPECGTPRDAATAEILRLRESKQH